MKQRQSFILDEGDQWFKRNKLVDMEHDPVLHSIKFLNPEIRGNILEIGCSDGKRLDQLKKVYQVAVHGVEPSKTAVTEANKKGLQVLQGTADNLPYANKKFDMLIFGFCLYLCDREELFLIASEADRVLNESGRLIVYDFDPGICCYNEYHHVADIKSYKMDYSQLFLWNPAYTLEHKTLYAHSRLVGHCVDKNERISVSIIRKQTGSAYVNC